MDVLRHAGRGAAVRLRRRRQQGDGRGRVAISPYTEADLQKQVDKADDLYGAEGAQLQQDVADYVAGINQYISEARTDPHEDARRVRGDRQDRSRTGRRTDVIATASLVGGIFGKGGGGELENATALERGQGALRRRRRRAGLAATSAAGRSRGADHRAGGNGSFAYQRARAARRRRRDARRGLAGRPAQQRRRACSTGGLGGLLGGLGRMGAMSNALLVSAAKSESGPPGRRDGPAGRLLHAADPGREGPARPRHRRRRRGVRRRQPVRAARPRPGLRVVGDLGRPGHHRHLRREAVRAGRLGADGAVDALPVQGRVPRRWRRSRATNDDHAEPGRPVAARRPTRSRRSARCTASSHKRGTVGRAAGRVRAASARRTSTRPTRRAAFAELEPALARCRTSRTSSTSCSKINFTFNWFYADDRDIGYFNSGDNPERADGVDSDLPELGHRRVRLEGLGTPTIHTADYTPVRRSTRRRSTRTTSPPGTTSRRPATTPPTASGATGRSTARRSLDEQIDAAARRREQDEPAAS